MFSLFKPLLNSPTPDMIPWDVVQYMAHFCSLRARYRLMMTCKGLSLVDWSGFLKRYRLSDEHQIKPLITKDYCTAWKVNIQRSLVWSLNLEAPLRIWSPKTTIWYTNALYVSVYFLNWRFLNFVRHLGNELALKTPSIQRRNRQRAVNVRLWRSRTVPSYVIEHGQRKKRRLWERQFTKKPQQVRCLLEFQALRLVSSLQPSVMELEFSP